MKSFDPVINEIQNVSNLQTSQSGLSLFVRNTKAVEELGEASQALLSYHQTVNTSQSLKGTVTSSQDVAEEYLDLAICALDLAFALGLSKEEMIEILLKKTQKWKSKLS